MAGISKHLEEILLISSESFTFFIFDERKSSLRTIVEQKNRGFLCLLELVELSEDMSED